MLYPWNTLSGWEARTIDTPNDRPFQVVQVDVPRQRVRVRNFLGRLAWLHGRELQAIYGYAITHGAVRPVDVYRILGSRNYRYATYVAALSNELLKEGSRNS